MYAQTQPSMCAGPCAARSVRQRRLRGDAARRLVVPLLLLVGVGPASGGVFIGAEQISGLITHTRGYTGAPGLVTVTVCIEPATPNAAAMEIPIRNAAATWTQLIPTIGNLLAGAANNVPANQTDFESVALHEIGHCIGLGHPNLADRFNGSEATSTTGGPNGAFNVNVGVDGVPGSPDDLRGDDENLHWFRIGNNNPFSIGPVVDRNTYTRALAGLPAGQRFAANADRTVGAVVFAVPNTEAVMQQGTPPDEAQRTLNHDDVATLRLAMAGFDELAGTGDDYTVRVDYAGVVPACGIRIRQAPLGGNAIGSCNPGQVAINGNHAVLGDTVITFNSAIAWFYNPVLTAPTTTTTTTTIAGTTSTTTSTTTTTVVTTTSIAGSTTTTTTTSTTTTTTTTTIPEPPRKLYIPVRWCAVRGTSAVENPACVEESNTKSVLWRRHERPTDNAYCPNCNVSWRSGAIHEQPTFPVIDDPCDPAVDSSCPGVTGDIEIDPRSNDFDEYRRAVAACTDAWAATGLGSIGVVGVNVRRFVRADGTPLSIGAVGGSPSFCNGAEQASSAASFAVIDNDFTRGPVLPGCEPQIVDDPTDQIAGQALGLAASLRQEPSTLMNPVVPHSNVLTAGGVGANANSCPPGVSQPTSQCGQLRLQALCHIPGTTVDPPLPTPPPPPPVIVTLADPIGDAAPGPVDLERVALVDDRAPGVARVVWEAGRFPFAAGTSRYAFALDLDANPLTGGDPATVGIDIPLTGVELVGQVTVRVRSGSAEPKVLETTCVVWLFSGGVFVEQLTLGCRAVEVAAAILDTVEGEPDLRPLSAVVTLAFSNQLLGNSALATLQGLASDGTVSDLTAPRQLTLATPTLPSCMLAPTAAMPGQSVDVTVPPGTLTPNTPAMVFFGATLALATTTDGAGGLNGTFTVPMDAMPGQATITVGETLAINPACTLTVLGSPSCGDGVLDGGEECDDGNLLGGDCCDSTCTREPDGARCSEHDVCTQSDVCHDGRCVGAPAFLVDRRARIGNRAAIERDLGANSPGGLMRLGREVTMPDGTTVIGDRVVVGNGSSVFRVLGNTIATGSGAVIRGGTGTPTLPIVDDALFCAIPTFACGGPEVRVPSGGTGGPLAPGQYGDLRIGDGGHLVLASGTFDFCSVRGGQDVEIVALGPGQTTINVEGTFRVFNGAILRTQAAPAPIVNVGGHQFRVGASGSIEAFVRVPDGDVRIGRQTRLLGTICASGAGTDKGITLECHVPEPPMPEE